MNARERLFAVLSGQPVDRRPVTPVLSLYGARLTGCALDRYFSDPLSYARGQAAVQETFAPDTLFGPFAFAKIGAAFGSQLREFANAAPNIRRPAALTVEDFLRLPVPDLEKNPHLAYFCEATRCMVDWVGRETPIAAVLPAPTDLPALILGMDAWMEMVLFERELAYRVLDVLAPFLVDFCNHLFSIGADFVVMPCALGSSAVVTREIAESFSKPVIAKTFSQLKKRVAFHHGGAPLLDHLDIFTNLPNVIGIGMDQQDDLTQARAIVGPTRVLFGGVFGPGLAGQTSTAIEEQCRTILRNRENDPRFIFYTCGPDIPFETSPENIRAIFRGVDGT